MIPLVGHAIYDQIFYVSDDWLPSLLRRNDVGGNVTRAFAKP